MPYDVFISYSSKDKPVADAVCAKLEAAGIRCWIAPRDVLAGQNWGQAIVGAIKGARVMVMVFSAHANFSPQITREVERAASRGMPIIPLRIEEVKPAAALEYYISTAHWLDAISPPLEKHLEELTRVVSLLLQEPEPRLAQPAPWPEPSRQETQPAPAPPAPPEPEMLAAKALEEQTGLIYFAKRTAKFVDTVLRIFFSIILFGIFCVLVWYFYRVWSDNRRQQAVENNPTPQVVSRQPRPFKNMERTIETPGNWLKVISISPDSPAILRSGQILTVKVQYAAKDAKQVWLAAYPYNLGHQIGYLPGRNFYQSASTNVSDGLVFFSCNGGNSMDQIKVTMTSEGNTLAEIFAPAQAKWLQAGGEPTPLLTNANYFISGSNWVRLVATTPASPAILAANQALAVNVQYSVGNSTKANISISPYTSGRSTPCRLGKTTGLSPGFARSYFSCRAMHVDQLEVEIHSISNTAGSIMAYFPVDLLWLDTATQETR